MAEQPLDYRQLYDSYRRRYDEMRHRYQTLRGYATDIIEDGEHYDDHTDTVENLRDHLRSTCATCGGTLSIQEQEEQEEEVEEVEDDEQYSYSCTECYTREVRPLLENLDPNA